MSSAATDDNGNDGDSPCGGENSVGVASPLSVATGSEILSWNLKDSMQSLKVVAYIDLFLFSVIIHLSTHIAIHTRHLYGGSRIHARSYLHNGVNVQEQFFF